MTGKPVERRIFPEGFDGIVGSDKGADKRGEPYENLRWSRFRHDAPKTMF